MATLVVSATDQSNDYSNCTNYDQSDTVVGNEWIAADEDCVIEYINTYLRRGDFTDGDAWLEIWNATRTAVITNGTSNTVAVSSIGQSAGVVQFTWSSGSRPSISNGVKYHIMLCSDTGSTSSDGIWWEGGSGNVSQGFYKWEMVYSTKSWQNQITDDSHYIEIYKQSSTTHVLEGTIGGQSAFAADLFQITGPYYEDRGSVGESHGSSSLSVPYPTTVDEDDILILQLLSTEVDNHNAISGWTKITEVDQGTNATASWYWKRAVGTESGNETATRAGSSGSFFGVMSRWKKCATTGTPFEEEASTSGSSSTAASSSITPTDDGRRVVCFLSIEGNVTVGTLTGGNYAEDFEVGDA